MEKKGSRQESFQKVVKGLCIVLLGTFLFLQLQSIVTAASQKCVSKSVQMKNANLGKNKGKKKCTYYKTTLNYKDYWEDYDLYKKNKFGLCWAVYFSRNKIYFHGSMSKSNVKSFSSGKEVYLKEKNRSFVTTSKTKYFIKGDESTKRISRNKISSYLAKGNKSILSFGIILTKVNGKVANMTIEI